MLAEIMRRTAMTVILLFMDNLAKKKKFNDSMFEAQLPEFVGP
jgi:hypothetical protein